MKNPQVGQLVWLEKLARTFVITAVHPDRRVADLQSTEALGDLNIGVPFGTIHALGGDITPLSRD
jgi:hypothetical protein